MSQKPSEVRVAMAKRVAEKWLQERAVPEYRLTVYSSASSPRNLPALLRSFRESKTRVAGIQPIQDMRIRAGSEKIDLWSSDRESLIKLNSWLLKNGCETTGIW